MKSLAEYTDISIVGSFNFLSFIHGGGVIVSFQDTFIVPTIYGCTEQ